MPVNTDLEPLASLPGLSNDTIARNLMSQLYRSAEFVNAATSATNVTVLCKPSPTEAARGMYADFTDLTQKGYLRASLVSMEKFSHEGIPYIFLFGQTSAGECHACGAETRLGIFALQHNAWNMIYEDRIPDGVWGRGPSIKVLRIGEKRYGFLFTHGDIAQGISDEHRSVRYFNEKEFVPVLRIDTHGNDGSSRNQSSTCHNRPQRAWQESALITQTPRLSQKMYDLVVSHTGTTLDKDCTVIPRTGSTTYSWDGFVYREHRD